MKPKILLITSGSKNKISHLADSFQSLYEAKIIYGQEYAEKKFDRLLYFFKKGNVIKNKKSISKKVLSEFNKNGIDLLITIKGLNISSKLLSYLKKENPKIKIFNWTCDDLFLKHNQTPDFLKSSKFYDLIYTSKSENLKNLELQKLGYKNIKFFYQRYSNKYHKPSKTKIEQVRYKVLFAGYAEEERFQYMNFLAKNGIEINVFGNGWDKYKYRLRRHNNLHIHYRPIIGEDYSQAIFSSEINLCFLRVLNRDIHTARSVEIPACGGFMLAQRTNEHLELFEEDTEAAYFSSKEECLSKVKSFLIDNKRREEIANNGFLKTRRSEYSYDAMAKEMYEDYLKL